MKVYYIPLNKSEQVFYSASDIHFGIKNCDIDIFKEELEEAKEREARIILNGDIFDAIFPKGDKRWNASLPIQELQGRDDTPTQAIKMMRKILQPYATQIDIIGMGNHELAVYKYKERNMIDELIEFLNVGLNGKHPFGGIKYGGYTGKIHYNFSDGNHAKVFKILYHHGAGGSSPVTKGMIDINRIDVNWEYDLYLFGHKHNDFAVRGVRMDSVAREDKKGYLYATDSRAVQTGSFYRNYADGADEDTKIPPYEEIAGHSPKPIGGNFIHVQMKRRYLSNPKTDVLVFKTRVEV